MQVKRFQTLTSRRCAMSFRCAMIGLALIGTMLLIAPAQAATADEALRLDLAMPANVLSHRGDWQARASHGNPLSRPDPTPARARPAEPGLPIRALQSVLDTPDLEREPVVSGSRPTTVEFRFERRGPAIKNLARSYRRMCDSVSRKLWDDPKGRRIKFDIAGKPGVGVEIPIR